MKVSPCHFPSQKSPGVSQISVQKSTRPSVICHRLLPWPHLLLLPQPLHSSHTGPPWYPHNMLGRFPFCLCTRLPCAWNSFTQIWKCFPPSGLYSRICSAAFPNALMIHANHIHITCPFPSPCFIVLPCTYHQWPCSVCFLFIICLSPDRHTQNIYSCHCLLCSILFPHLEQCLSCRRSSINICRKTECNLMFVGMFRVLS